CHITHPRHNLDRPCRHIGVRKPPARDTNPTEGPDRRGTAWNRIQGMRATKQRELFDRWIREHRGLMLKVVRAYAFTADDQEDLLQEIALQLWNSIPNHRGEAAESTWIYRVALYSALGWTRKERKHRSGRTEIEDVQPA